MRAVSLGTSRLGLLHRDSLDDFDGGCERDRDEGDWGDDHPSWLDLGCQSRSRRQIS